MVKQLETRFKRIETKYVVSYDNYGNQGTWQKARLASSYLRQTWFERAKILKIQLRLS